MTEPGGNTNVAGIGNLAGRIRIEELAAGEIRHALAISVPCTDTSWVWPANHAGHEESCNNRPHLPPAGQLLWLRTAPDQITDPRLGTIPPWSMVILRAMHRYGVYVMDNGGQYLGPDSGAFFQLQTKAQVQYRIADRDPWGDWAMHLADQPAATGWTLADGHHTGSLQGLIRSSETGRAAAWDQFWRHNLVAVNNCSFPRPAETSCSGE